MILAKEFNRNHFARDSGEHGHATHTEPNNS